MKGLIDYRKGIKVANARCLVNKVVCCGAKKNGGAKSAKRSRTSNRIWGGWNASSTKRLVSRWREALEWVASTVGVSRNVVSNGVRRVAMSGSVDERTSGKRG